LLLIFPALAYQLASGAWLTPLDLLQRNAPVEGLGMKNFCVALNVSEPCADTSTVALAFSPSSELRRSESVGFAPSSTSSSTSSSASRSVLEGSTTVVATIFRHGLQRPNHIALVDDTGSLTYAQLAARIQQFASKLQKQGVTRGHRVGVALEPDVVTVTWLLALHSIGAAYVALDDSQPTARLVGMVADAGIEWVLSAAGSVPQLANVPIGHLDASSLEAECAQDSLNSESTKNPGDTGDSACGQADLPKSENTVRCVSSAVSPGDLAYIIFTSGSTGRPKGVAITQANLNALMRAWDRVMCPSTAHTSLLLSALTFDASVAELFWPLHSGGTLIVASKDQAHPGGLGIGSLIGKHKIDHLQCTPTRATLLLSDPFDRAALANIKHLVIGGEALTRSLAQRLLEAGIAGITNAYGPTEATVWAFTNEVTAELPSEIVGIGYPLDGVAWAVVDDAGQDVTEVGVLGELVLGGPFVSSGYVNQPDLTGERFFERSYNPQTLSTLHSYRTGDLVARNADGTLAFHGRSDEQVKIRGHRVELGEIEAALMTHPQVAQGVVCAHWRNEANELVAFVVLNPTHAKHLAADTRPIGDSSETGSLDDNNLGRPSQYPSSTDDVSPVGVVQALRGHLAQLLPKAFVPSRIVVVDALPLTTSHKVDRVRVRTEMLPSVLLDEPSYSETNSGNNLDDARIKAMINDFSVVLGAGSQSDLHVREDTDFFAVGGHSMFAVALLARIQKRTGVCLPLRSLLGASTPATMSLIVQNELAKPAPFDPLVRFRLSTATRRVHLVHGAGGNVLRYRNLAKAVGDLAEIVGIQAIGVEPGNPPDRTLSAMVDRYTAALLATNEESFELGGYSDGGILALHIAHRLRAAGKQVRSLLLLDAFAPGSLPTSVGERLANMRFTFASRDSLSIAQWLRGSFVGWKKRGDWDVEGSEALQRMGYVDIYAINERAVQGEILPELFAAPTLVVRTFEETPTKRRNYAIGFDSSQATTAWVHGPHDELLKPETIAELAPAVRSFLHRV
jgi:amino acid adenylation domain-containing protein